jgi:RNA polymerase sigma-70 factor (ECF subfamily)
MESRLAIADLQKAADTLVIALACAGDDGAFAEVLRRRQPRVRSFMYHLCRQPALSDDLTQQVFLAAWHSLGQLRSAVAFDGWLKRIMVSVWLKDVRRSKVASVSDLDLADFPAQDNFTTARMDLDAALATLPPDKRLCVVLAYDQGLSHPEIVELTGLPLGTVKSHIARAAMRLREILADYGVGA